MAAVVKAAAKPPSIKDESASSGKIYIEGYTKEAKDVITVKVPLKDGQPATGVFIGGCSDCTIKLEGKAKNITISGCKNVNLLFENCVTMCEIIRCERCNVQAEVAAGTFQVDKCDRLKLYLPNESLASQVLIYSSQSSSTNVYFENDDGSDMIEYALPEQLVSTFKKGAAPTTTLNVEGAAGVTG